MSNPTTSVRPWRVVVVAGLAVFFGLLAACTGARREALSIPYFKPSIGTVREPLPDRIVSFHRGRADKRLIQLASQLGFNGVQFQIEGSNVQGIQDFADRDAREHLIDFCHSLNMKVTLWVHELSDLPGQFSADYLGPVAVDNPRIWDELDRRYEWILATAVPRADGLVLTTVETQINATSTPIMLKIVDLIDRKCREHGKALTVRTFVWHPDELESVMAAIEQMPAHIPVMSKVVPQDWQMRGGHAAEIGAVGSRTQIVEYDVEGEYFLHNSVANCMVDRLKQQFDYGLSKNVKGICVRVDRGDDNVLFEPSEVNLWALGLLASGATTNTEEIWSRWAAYRYGEKAAPAVIAALKATSQVVAELLSIGPFTFGDTRYFPYTNARLQGNFLLPDDPVFEYNWQMWRWNPQFFARYQEASQGSPDFTAQVAADKAAALKLADECLQKLEVARPLLPWREYDILHSRLLSNQTQLQIRTPMALAALHIRQYAIALQRNDTIAAANALDAYRQDLSQLNRLSVELDAMGPAGTMRYLGKDWQVNAPLLGPWFSSPAVLRNWTRDAAARVVDDTQPTFQRP